MAGVCVRPTRQARDQITLKKAVKVLDMLFWHGDDSVGSNWSRLVYLTSERDNMNIRLRLCLVLSVVFSAAPSLASVTIDAYTYDLGQFSGAAVTYRSDGSVAFDGKLWDNEVGVDTFTTGELAEGQFGSDPGDQLTLQNTASPDWFELNYGGSGITIGGTDADTFVVYEITSSTSGVDTEGTSWRISFNGGAFIDASSGTATFLDFSSSGVENVNQIAFDLTDFGFSSGDLLDTVRVENIDSGSGTSDPDFIFTALEGADSVVPELSSIAIWSVLALIVSPLGSRRSRRR